MLICPLKDCMYLIISKTHAEAIQHALGVGSKCLITWYAEKAQSSTGYLLVKITL
jgi:hypothetical protein